MLAHLIGFSFWWYLVIDLLADRFPLPYVRLNELPIIAVMFFLLLDRPSHRKRYRIGLWEITFIAFAAFYGVGLIYAELFMVRASGVINYGDWMRTFLTPLLFYIVIIECNNREHFSMKVLIYWLVGTIAFIAMLGLLQAGNVAGFRNWFRGFYQWDKIDAKLVGPSAEYQARGISAHANGHAEILSMGLATVAFLFSLKVKKWVVVGYSGLVALSLFFTYSRGGILAMTLIIVGICAFYIVRRKWVISGVIGGCFLGAMIAFLAMVYAFDIKRYKEPLEGRSIARANMSISSWYDRIDTNNRMAEMFRRFPVFGASPAGAGLNRQGVLSYNYYNAEGVTGTAYYQMPAYFGFGGLVFVFIILLLPFTPLIVKFPRDDIAIGAIVVGCALVVFCASENILTSPFSMVVANVIMGVHIAVNQHRGESLLAGHQSF
ncbi:MAG: O-antigen ligase family protein [Fimbriimonadaceae bacterium]|nr:O-antigen ligase family protein [Fimbriimonadaceae bacterium]